MVADEMKKTIRSVMFFGVPYGLTIFTCLRNGGAVELKKFLTNDKLRDQIKEMLESSVEGKFCSEEAELDSSDNIADNRNILYEVAQNEEYAPFAFLDCEREITAAYSEEDQRALMGLVFRINLNDCVFWLYQHAYRVRMVQSSKSIYAMITRGDTYVPLDRDVLKIDSRVDILIIGDSIITLNIGLLQNEFVFERHIRSEAAKTIESIKDMDIISDMTKLFMYEGKQKLTNAKKLLKAKNSPVLQMKKADLISALQAHSRYKDIFEFENGRIKISSQSDVGDLIRMLNDRIVRSELTNKEYDSPTKRLLEPVGV